jgi:iron complex outermembrane receptor protein
MKCHSIVVAMAALGPRLFAVETAPAASAAGSAKSGDIVQLSEFDVQSGNDQGYAAAETLSGPRVKTKIVELPYSVEVLTSEFFNDFAIFSLDDTLTQIGSFTGLSSAGTFTLRGFSNSYQLRDGFYRIGRYGVSNIDRIEVIKGPSAAVYGRTDPGGMVNMISKQPRPQFGASLTMNYGSYDTQRQTLETTGTLLDSRYGQTTFLITASQFTRKYDVPFAENRKYELLGSLKHTFKDGSALYFSAEYFMQYQHGLQQEYGAAAPIVQVKTASGTTAVGYDAALAEHDDAFGPHSEFNRDDRSFTATYEKRFSNVWSLRFGSNLYRDHSWQENNNTSFGTITVDTTNPAAAATTTRGVPTKQIYSEDGGAVQMDIVADTRVFNDAVGTRTLATVDMNDYYRWDPNYTIGTAANNPTVAAWSSGAAKTALGPDLLPLAPIGYYPENWTWNTVVVNNAHHNRQTVLGGLISERASFFNDTLLFYGGGRYDIFRYFGRDFHTAVTSFNKFPGYADYQIGDQVRRTFHEWKPNVGVNWQFVKGYYAYVNYSESWTVNQGDQAATVADPTYKPETAEGWDYGIKGDILGDRLTFTLTGFYARRQNVSVNELVETPPGSGNYVVAAVRDGDQLVRGYEWDLNWRMTDELNLVGSWGHVYSIYTNFGADAPLAVGRRVNGVAPENGGISMRYGPRTGWLRGFSANLGYTYVGRTPTEAPSAGDTYSKPDSQGHVTLTSTTRQWALSVPAISLWNAGVRYALRTTPRFSQQIAINVNNVFDRIYLKATKAPGDRRAVYVTYQIGFGSYRP